MAVVTITTDLGTADYYLAALKGSLYKHCGEVAIVDVNCQLKHFDIKQAVYHLQQAYSYFPNNTIHLIHINPNFSSQKILVTNFNNHYFVSFDNGFLPLFLRENRTEFFVVNNNLFEQNTISSFDKFAIVSKNIISKKSLSDFTNTASEYIRMSLPNPTAGASGIKGNIVSIDAFGNAITNISKAFFESQFIGKKFTVRVNQLVLYEIKNNYADVIEGDLVCFFNDSGLLEISLNRGRASSLLGLSVSQNIMIVAE